MQPYSFMSNRSASTQQSTDGCLYCTRHQVPLKRIVFGSFLRCQKARNRVYAKVYAKSLLEPPVGFHQTMASKAQGDFSDQASQQSLAAATAAHNNSRIVQVHAYCVHTVTIMSYPRYVGRMRLPLSRASVLSNARCRFACCAALSGSPSFEFWCERAAVPC
jgi:hypothetical protein